MEKPQTLHLWFYEASYGGHGETSWYAITKQMLTSDTFKEFLKAAGSGEKGVHFVTDRQKEEELRSEIDYVLLSHRGEITPQEAARLKELGIVEDRLSLEDKF